MADAESAAAFKARALDRLKQRGEPERDYAIAASDLIALDACPLCRSANLAPIASVYVKRELRFFATAACRDCLFVFRTLFPSYRWFQQCWARIATGVLEVFNTELEELRRVRYQQYLDLIRPHAKTGRVLDIGAAYGTGSRLFVDAGYEVEALEPEIDRARYIETVHRIKTHTASIEEFAPAKPYDVILSSHNLEHLDDPAGAVHKMREWLIDGGILYLEVPLLWNMVEWSDALFLAHKSNFLECGLGELLGRHGFRPVHKHYPRLNNPAHADIGAVLRAEAGRPVNAGEWRDDRSGHSLDDIRRLYRKDLPFPDAFPLDAPLRYSIPRINHFYYSVRTNEGQFVDRRATTGFIEFVTD